MAEIRVETIDANGETTVTYEQISDEDAAERAAYDRLLEHYQTIMAFDEDVPDPDSITAGNAVEALQVVANRLRYTIKIVKFLVRREVRGRLRED